MAKAASFYKRIFEVCPNAIIPNAKLKAGLKNAHERTPIYHHHQKVDDWVSDVSNRLRQVARWYRMIKECDEQMETTLKKALGMNVL